MRPHPIYLWMGLKTTLNYPSDRQAGHQSSQSTSPITFFNVRSPAVGILNLDGHGSCIIGRSSRKICLNINIPGTICDDNCSFSRLGRSTGCLVCNDDGNIVRSIRKIVANGHCCLDLTFLPWHWARHSRCAHGDSGFGRDGERRRKRSKDGEHEERPERNHFLILEVI
jgi:hypothetical protein